jgi:hypothetical protein
MAFRHVLCALATTWVAFAAEAKTPPVKGPKPAPKAKAAVSATPSAPRGGGDSGFHLDRLPQGKNVTIPRPATTYVPLARTVSFTATDTPQSLSLKPINLKAGGFVGPLRVSIMDRESGKLQYVDLKPGMPFLYNFKELGSITVVPQSSGTVVEGLSLQVESDKPLEIAH